ncbi:MAG TPA: ABC transporter transmembrane domain-containing protein [Blastocatellia bacterium]|nr:ABC transporter transmembrane domain-containing protein [Blastocatellia bacterium]
MKPQPRQGSPRDLLRLLSYAKPYRLRITLALLCFLIAGALGLIFPQVLRRIIDATFTSDKDLGRLNQFTLLLAAVFFGEATFAFFRTYLMASTGQKVLADIRLQLYGHLLKLPASFFATRSVGELTSRLAADVTTVQAISTIGMVALLRQSLQTTGALVLVILTNPKLAALMLAIVPLVVLGAAAYGRYIKRISVRVLDNLAAAMAVLSETLSAIRVVQLFVREDYERGRYGAKVQATLKVAVRRALANGGFQAFMIFAVSGGILIVFWAGSRMVITGQITPGELIAFLVYTSAVAQGMGGLSEVYAQFNEAIGATRRIFELLDTKPAIADGENAQPLTEVRGHVQLRDVHFSYPDERNAPVLSGINIDAKSGQIIALVGPSGAGKTTLISLIPRFYDVAAGAILIDGQDVRSLRLADLRQAIGVVPQETILFSGTVRENIAYGKLDASEAEIEAVARAAHAHDFISEFPAGYDTVVGEKGVKLSGGQRQRIAIARALLKDPAILVLDEATSSLDSESEYLIQSALETLMQGRTTFVIAHRLSTIRQADRIVVMDQGRIVEEGAHDELLTSAGLYRQLYDRQFQKQAPVAEAAD